MGNKRRKDKAHDVGDSMPGTVGDSDGTIHDRRDGPTFDPEEVEAQSQTATSTNRQKQTGDQQQESSGGSTGNGDTGQTEEQSKRMKYAAKYGDSWPTKRQRRFLREHDVSAKEMGWKLTE